MDDEPEVEPTTLNKGAAREATRGVRYATFSFSPLLLFLFCCIEDNARFKCGGGNWFSCRIHIVYF